MLYFYVELYYNDSMNAYDFVGNLEHNKECNDLRNMQSNRDKRYKKDNIGNIDNTDNTDNIDNMDNIGYNLEYDRVLDKIENSRRFGKEPGVVVTQKVISKLKSMGMLKTEIPYFHVAGTNGKGSTCAFLSEILREAGCVCGRFTSPHLTHFEERITINGEMIKKDDVTRLGNFLLNIDFEIELTMFDYCLAMALLYFEENKCDVMVIETGLGGRLDSTNALGVPCVSIITKIGYDHMAILGDDIVSIAREKAGIIKHGSIVVTEEQQDDVMAVLEEKSKCEHTRLIKISDADSDKDKDKDILSDVKLGLIGEYQKENASAAALAAKIYLQEKFNYELINKITKTTKTTNESSCDSFAQQMEYTQQFSIDQEIKEKIRMVIKSGLENTSWPGRMEILSKEPYLLVDGAHNSNGVCALKQSLDKLYPDERFNFIIGVMADKDYEQMIDEMLPLAKSFYTVTPDSNRALQSEKLAEFIRKKGVEALSLPNISDIKASLSKNEKNVAFGSLYFIGDLRRIISQSEITLTSISGGNKLVSVGD